MSQSITMSAPQQTLWYLETRQCLFRYESFGTLSLCPDIILNTVKSFLFFLDIHVNAGRYRGILQNTLLPFVRQYFQDNVCYQEGGSMTHCTRIVNAFFQQEGIINMQQTTKSSDCNPTEYLWRIVAYGQYGSYLLEFGRAVKALIENWAEILV